MVPPPWARCLGPEAGDQCGKFGDSGARSESFAVGSVLYFITRGHEPYDDGEFGPQVGSAQVSLLQFMLFPSLDNTPLDIIIQKCWYGEYNLLEDLAKDSKQFAGRSTRPRATALDPILYKHIQNECQQLVDAGFLELKK